MPFVELYGTGDLGIVKDIAAHELPPEAWNDGRNVRFVDSKVRQMEGHVQFDASICAAPTFCIAVPQQNTSADILVYCSETDVYAYTGSANAKLTASGLSATGQNTWTGTLLSGILVLSRGRGKPQHWVFPPNTATTLTDLPDWSASWSCAVIRSYKNYLVALNTTEGASSYPYRVRWSHAADSGAVPTSWNAADVTLDAGFNDLLEGGDFIVDACPMTDRLLIYKENSVWSMSYIGGVFIFDFQKIYSDWGLLSRHAVAPIGNRHFVVGTNEIYIHDGYSPPQPLLQGRMKNFFFSNIDRTQTDKIFCVPNHPYKEVWVCYPGTAGGVVSKALVWNYETNVWSIRDVPAPVAAATCAVEYAGSGSTWNNASGTWDDALEVWNSETNYRENRVILASKDNGKLYLADSGWKNDSSNIVSYVERRALPLAGVDRNGNPKPLHEAMHMVRAVWPRITCRKRGTISIYVGTQADPMSTVTWYGPYRYNPITDLKIDCRVTGRFIAIKFEGNDDLGWVLDSFAMDVDKVGRY